MDDLDFEEGDTSTHDQCSSLPHLSVPPPIVDFDVDEPSFEEEHDGKGSL